MVSHRQCISEFCCKHSDGNTVNVTIISVINACFFSVHVHHVGVLSGLVVMLNVIQCILYIKIFIQYRKKSFTSIAASITKLVTVLEKERHMTVVNANILIT